ncbi:MAG: bifunctional aspartate kinase/homoserine dehydrogenase I [Patescibacteria group bacterium]
MPKAAKFVKVMKFGGSSVGSAERIQNVAKIVLEARKNGGVAVVVSAMQGVTDKLLALDFDFVKEKHLTAAKELRVAAPTELLSELESVMKGIKLLGDASPMALDLVVSFGERLSANLVSAYINKKTPSIAVDSRELVKTDSNFQNASVDFVVTNRNIQNFFRKLLNPKSYSLKPIPVITGFISSNIAGKTTTLGRGGSDYSGAIFGAALGADVIEIWTDADGVMTADPRIVKSAFTLSQISYEEAFEMAYFGAKVIHPATMVPAIKKGIPVLIKNTFNPKHPGTEISSKKQVASSKDFEGPVKNISSVDGMSLITVGGTELAGMPGTAERVFRAAAEAKANVVLIAQASSEHTICLAVKKSEADRAVSSIKSEFENDIRRGKVAVERKDGQSIVAVVGDNMRGVPGIAGKIFNSLGRAKINIAAIAQGGSERNVSLVVSEEKKAEAINVLHSEFFDSKSLRIFLVGTGVVGSQLLQQLASLKFRVQSSKLEIGGIADVEKMHLKESGIDLKNWKKDLKNGEKVNLPEFVRQAAEMRGEKVFVDCTASERVARMYPQLVKAGFHIVTPNKKFNVLPHKEYSGLRSLLATYQKSFHYDANVGAGLPVIATIKNLLAAGDQIKKIEGVFSGTLSYLFNNFSGKNKFSDLVARAKALGYTEPDPREDLSGQDVGRKLLILARELGLPAEFSDVKLESLVKPDAYFAGRIKKAKAKKSVLRYVATVQNGRMAASLKEVPMEHPIAGLSGADNIFAIYTKYYKNPLVIRGAGAGAEVTAAAVLNGILRIKNGKTN